MHKVGVTYPVFKNFKSEKMATLGKRKKRKLYYCGHCQKDVSKATYYRHRTEFYDDVLKDWRRAKAVRLS
jgi:hypothetical protein